MVFDFIIENFDYIAPVVLTIMMSNLLFRSIKDVKNGLQWNWLRTVVIFCLLSNFLEYFVRILHNDFGLINFLFDIPVPISTILPRCIVVFGFIFVTHINGWKTLMFLPAYYLVGAILFQITTGIEGPLEYFFDFGGLIVFILLFEIVYRVRDNTAFGLGIFFLFSFGATLLEMPILDVISLVFGIIWSIGWFKPFKNQSSEEIEDDEPGKDEEVPATEILEVEL